MRAHPMVAAAFTVLMFPASGESANLTCSSATTLDALATCIRNQMPASGSNGYVAPNSIERADWRAVVQQMLTGSCSISMPSSLAGIVEVRAFTDTGNGRPYCLLMEVLDGDSNGRVDRGWGTFMVYGAAVREVSHQAPHPISDSTTENQAIGIFRDTDSRSYLMAGAHRSANSGSSACQSSYGPADAAHNVDNMFHATNEELMAFYGASDWWALQWHGMAADTCSAAEVYLSHGRDVVPSTGDKTLELKTNMLGYHPTWGIETTGVGACTLNATDNTQGRLINGVSPSSVCSTAAANYSGRFLHAEQDPGFRTASDWAQAVTDTWPTAPTSPPPPPAIVSATGGNAQVSLSWSSSAGAVTYKVLRSTTSGGPYVTRASGLSGTAFVDSPLTNGTTYFYVVSAVNPAGESPHSPQASSTPQAPAVPLAPTSVTATAAKRKITLAWTASAGATKYRVKRSTTTGGPYTTVATNVTATTFTNIGLTSGVRYYYVVSASNASGEGPDSAQVTSVAK